MIPRPATPIFSFITNPPPVWIRPPWRPIKNREPEHNVSKFPALKIYFNTCGEVLIVEKYVTNHVEPDPPVVVHFIEVVQKAQYLNFAMDQPQEFS
jgi:hypothetical protein